MLAIFFLQDYFLIYPYVWAFLCLLFFSAAYYRGAMGILLVYDVTDESSFNSNFSFSLLSTWEFGYFRDFESFYYIYSILWFHELVAWECPSCGISLSVYDLCIILSSTTDIDVYMFILLWTMCNLEAGYAMWCLFHLWWNLLINFASGTYI